MRCFGLDQTGQAAGGGVRVSASLSPREMTREPGLPRACARRGGLAAQAPSSGGRGATRRVVSIAMELDMLAVAALLVPRT